MSLIWHTTCREVELGIASDCRVLKNFKTERTNDSDKLIIYKPSRSQLSLILEILAITLAKLGLVAALRLSPVGRGQELDGWPTANIVVEVHTLFFFFFFFFYANRMVLFLKVYWKAFFRAPHLEKKFEAQICQCVAWFYYTSVRSTKLKLCTLWSIHRRGNPQQTNKFGFSTV